MVACLAVSGEQCAVGFCGRMSTGCAVFLGALAYYFAKASKHKSCRHGTASRPERPLWGAIESPGRSKVLRSPGEGRAKVPAPRPMQARRRCQMMIASGNARGIGQRPWARVGGTKIAGPWLGWGVDAWPEGTRRVMWEEVCGRRTSTE